MTSPVLDFTSTAIGSISVCNEAVGYSSQSISAEEDECCSKLLETDQQEKTKVFKFEKELARSVSPEALKLDLKSDVDCDIDVDGNDDEPLQDYYAREKCMADFRMRWSNLSFDAPLALDDLSAVPSVLSVGQRIQLAEQRSEYLELNGRQARQNGEAYIAQIHGQIECQKKIIHEYEKEIKKFGSANGKNKEKEDKPATSLILAKDKMIREYGEHQKMLSKLVRTYRAAHSYMPRIEMLARTVVQEACLVECTEIIRPIGESSFFNFFRLQKIYLINGLKYLDTKIIRMFKTSHLKEGHMHAKLFGNVAYQSLEGAKRDFLFNNEEIENRHKNEVFPPISDELEKYYTRLCDDRKMYVRYLGATVMYFLPNGARKLSFKKEIRVGNITSYIVLDQIVASEEAAYKVQQHFMSEQITARQADKASERNTLVFDPLRILADRAGARGEK